MQLSRKDVCLTYFYFNFKGLGQSAEIVVTSLLKQMLLRLKKLPPDLEAAYKSWKDEGLNRPDGEEFAEIFAACSKKFSTVFVIVEAFNECPEGERDTLVTYLKTILESAVVKLYITTRSHLQSSLQQILEMNREAVEISAHPKDIEKYVRKQLLARKFYDDTLKNQIVEKVQENAQGM